MQFKKLKKAVAVSEEKKILATKTPREDFLRKVLPPKCVLGCFHVLQRVLSRHMPPFP